MSDLQVESMDWIKNTGDMPLLDPCTEVKVVCANHEIETGHVSDFYWSFEGHPADIKQYMILPRTVPIASKEVDAINPAHYKDIIPGFEYFDLMDYILRDWKGSQAHALGHAYKYLMRLGKKDDIPQELGKAIWYLTRLKEDIEKQGKL